MSTREREFPPNSRRRWLVTTCFTVALAALALAGCGGSSGNTSKASKNVSFALPPSSPPTSIFPLLSSAQYTNVNLNQFTKLLFVPLYWIGHGKHGSDGQRDAVDRQPTRLVLGWPHRHDHAQALDVVQRNAGDGS